MKTISAHITSFYHSTFHAYTTEVNVDGHRWRLGLRYSKFHEFYDQLVLKDKDFDAAFPPKGTLFFTPKPEARQQQLEEFLQQVLAFYVAKGCPADIEDLLCDLLKVPHHLRDPDHEDDNVSTSTESVLSEPVHEPPTESVAVEKAVEEEETKVAVPLEPVTEPETSTADASLETTEEAPVQEEATPAVPVAKEEESVSEPEEAAASAVVEEAQPLALEDDTEEVKTSVSAEEAMTQEVVKDDAPAKEEHPVQESESAHEDVAEVTSPKPDEEAVKDDKENVPVVAAEEKAAVEPITHEPEVSSPKEEPVVEPVVQTPDMALPKPAETRMEEVVHERKDDHEEEEKTKELNTRERTSTSWLAAYLPKSLLGFIRHRCMKKTNLVMLCVAILLPMVLARR